MSDLPQEWVETTFSEIFDHLQYGLTAKADSAAQGTRFLRITDIHNGMVSWDSVPGLVGEHDLGRYLLADGDFVFARSGSIEKAARLVNPPNAVFASYLIRARLLIPQIADYLAYFVRSDGYLAQIADRAAGIGMSNVNAAKLGTIAVSIPPLPEQRRIVAKIDSLTGKSRRARDHLDHIPRLVEKYKQAILVAAFRGDLTREWRLRTENELLKSPLISVRSERDSASLSMKRRKALNTLASPPAYPLLPTNWELACIDEIASDEPMSIQSGPFGSNLLHSEFTKSGKLVIGIDNVQDGYFSPGSQNRIPDKKFKELIRFRAKPLDVLITVMATIGRVCVLPADIEPAIITKHVYRISVDNRIALPDYIAMGLRGAEIALDHMGANVRGQTRPGLNGSIVKATFLPIPPLLEQAEIVHRIETAFAWIDRLLADANSARTLVDRLDQAVLCKAFKGKLVPQDPTDEPASALLERIKAERVSAPKTKRGRKKAT